MVKVRVVSVFLIFALLVGSVRSTYAWGVNASTVNDVFRLTSAGQAKALASAVVLSNGLNWARLIMGVSVGISALQLGVWLYHSGLWDWVDFQVPIGSAVSLFDGAVPLGGGARLYSAGGVEWLYYIDCQDGAPGYAWHRVYGPIGAPAGWTFSGNGRMESSGFCSGYYGGWGVWVTIVNNAGVPALFKSPAAELLGDLSTHTDLAVAVSTLNQARPVAVTRYGAGSAAVAAIDAALGVVASGVSLTAGTDYGPGVGLSPSGVPGAVDGVSSPPVDLSGVTSAITSMSSAVTAAIAASQSAVVAAVAAVAAPIVAAVAASQAAVVSAVSAVTSAVSAAGAATVAAVAASQAAVVSAVQSIVAPIVASVTGVQTAVESVGAKVDALKAQEAAQDSAGAAVSPSTAPAVVCPVCTRADKWADAWEALRVAGMAAPVFGLINRIVINPTGTIEHVRTVHTTNFGTLRFDLSAWGIDTYIGVVRYVVIFAALMAGYFVIFG